MKSEFRHRASLALNVVLAVASVVLVLHKSKSVPAASALAVSPDRSEIEKPTSTQESKMPLYSEAASPSSKRRWLIDQLRAMGVPNNVLARIVLADLDKQWTSRATEVSKKSWGDPDTMAALQLENDMSRDAEMRSALGEAGFKQWDRENMIREVNRGKIELTSAETDATYALWKKLQQRELELKQAGVKGEMDEADINDAYEKAVSGFKQQMNALLGDERYAKSQQTDEGAAAASLRQDFARVNPNDSQFQDLLKTEQQWNDQRTALDKQFQDDPSSAAYAEQIKALDAARDQEYRQVLGTNVFDAFQKEQDPGYSQMKKYETLWGLDDDKIDSVYATMKYYQKSVDNYQSQARALESQGQKVDWDAVNKNLQQFADQTRQALQNYVGEGNFNKMLRNGVFQPNPPQLTQHSPPPP
jgi:hypothetical protein